MDGKENMILPIYTFGQPVLRQEAEEIDKDYPELEQLIKNMYETLERSEGIGLAAPQVGLPIRLEKSMVLAMSRVFCMQS